MSHQFFAPEAPDNNELLSEERIRLDHLKYDGTRCRGCGQFVKIYDRRMRACWAHFLRECHREYGLESFQTTTDEFRRELPRANDWTFLEDFGLMKKTLNPETGRPRRGWWEVTVSGEQFVNGVTDVPEMIQMYDDQVIGESSQRITFAQAMQMTGEFDETEPLKPATRPPLIFPTFGFPENFEFRE